MSTASVAASEVATAREVMVEEIRDGLSRSPKELPCKYFYDDEGSRLFEKICDLEAYYPTRTEISIMQQRGVEMAAAIGPGALVIEYGSGSSLKTELLLAALEEPAGCVLIDISREHLLASAKRLEEQFPGLEVLPVEADYTQDFELPERASSGRLIYFPGSTIGNFDRAEAEEFLREMAEVAGPSGGLLIGVDLVKDLAVLELAYDDPEGVTAAFNLNLLAHLNREIGTDFDLERFRHVAFFNQQDSRIEMHLESVGEQTVHLGDQSFHLADGERICTEHSNKYRLDGFAEMAAAAGWRVERVWTDERDYFSVQYLRRV